MTKQIRFPHFSPAGEAIKIKLHEGQSLTHHHWHRTDEGWSSENTCWFFDGERVECEWYTDGVDCDGRFERFGESFFYASEVKEGYIDPDGVQWPRWRDLASGQRDHSAEAMGY
jgi:hypothetical protein